MWEYDLYEPSGKLIRKIMEERGRVHSNKKCVCVGDQFTNEVKYPDEVKGESIERALRREMRKGRVFGHFC